MLRPEQKASDLRSSQRIMRKPWTVKLGPLGYGSDHTGTSSSDVTNQVHSFDTVVAALVLRQAM